ncbi:MAG TPA: AbrB/MazE/SpoVT family DNA-binding domain-containing protein [Acidobacteria bacterium]|nr:AbrB/MazE/SpoVT family DNA-binding domain-containing protein [Acidobacteriota bacterium]
MSEVSVSSKGQIVIPRDLRERVGIRQGTVLEVEFQDGAIVLRPIAYGPEPSPGGWRRWRGAFRDQKLVNDLLNEHDDEVRRERLP